MAIYTNIYTGDSEDVQAWFLLSRKDLAQNTDPTFDYWVRGCFTLKPTLDCDTLIFEEFPDYRTGVLFLDINVTLIQKTDCGDVIASPTQNYTTGSPPIHFTDIDADGVYCAEVEISFVAENFSAETVAYNETLHISYEKDCCKKLYDALSVKMLAKMSSDSCTMVKYSKVGRNVLQLKKSYTKISNLMWAYNNSSDACSERDKSFCLFNKIK